MDTIVYKIHNLDKYPALVSCVEMFETGKGKMQVPQYYTNDEQKFNKFSTLWFNLKHDFYHIITYNTNVKLPSSESNVNIFYDRGQNIIRIEFSIPKFYYGNNVMEIIPPLTSKYYKPNMNLQNIASYWLKIIKETIKKIVWEITNGVISNIDLSDVEVSRLDICFNQIFENKFDALQYLDAQKQIKAKRVQEKRHQIYETALAIKTNDYYFKIYHKGAEFANVGKKQILKTCNELYKQNKLNENSNLAKSNKYLNHIENYSDRILRYELGANKPLMSYLFSYHLNKQFLPKYRIIQKLVLFLMEQNSNYELYTSTQKYFYDRINNKLYKSKSNASKLLLLDVHYYRKNENNELERVTDETVIKRLDKIYNALDILRKVYHIEGIPKIKELHKFFKKESGKEFNFFLERKPNQINFQTTTQNIHLWEQTSKDQCFNIEILTLLIIKFEQLFKSYQLEEMPTINFIVELAKKHNENLKNSCSKSHKINLNHIKLIASHIHNGYSLDSLKKLGFHSRKTIYNYRKKLDDLLNLGKAINFSPDITTKNLSKDTKTLYKKHYNEILNNNFVLQTFLNTFTTN